MKKFLSIFIAVAMVMSFAGVFASAPTAMAADAPDTITIKSPTTDGVTDTSLSVYGTFDKNCPAGYKVVVKVEVVTDDTTDPVTTVTKYYDYTMPAEKATWGEIKVPASDFDLTVNEDYKTTVSVVLKDADGNLVPNVSDSVTFTWTPTVTAGPPSEINITSPEAGETVTDDTYLPISGTFDTLVASNVYDVYLTVTANWTTNYYEVKLNKDNNAWETSKTASSTTTPHLIWVKDFDLTQKSTYDVTVKAVVELKGNNGEPITEDGNEVKTSVDFYWQPGGGAPAETSMSITSPEEGDTVTNDPLLVSGEFDKSYPKDYIVTLDVYANETTKYYTYTLPKEQDTWGPIEVPAEDFGLEIGDSPSVTLHATLADDTGFSVGVETSPVTFTWSLKDTEPPVLTITSPKDGATVDTDKVTVSGNVYDNTTAVESISLYIDSKNVGVMPVSVIPDGSFSETVQLSEGKNTIKVIAFDKAGNKAEKDITVTKPVDTTSPTITITSPGDGATVDTDTVKVTGTVTDNVGVTSLYIGSEKIDFAPDGSFSETVQLSEGKNTIKVFAFDAADNKAEKDITVTYKKPAPVKKTVVTVQLGSDVMTVNGQVEQLDAKPVIHEGHTYLPLRAIAEALGARVDWIAETKGITLTLGKQSVGLQIGNVSAVVNGNVIAVFPPYLQPYGDGTYAATMVPLRVIAEGLGATVNWSPTTRTVMIISAQ